MKAQTEVWSATPEWGAECLAAPTEKARCDCACLESHSWESKHRCIMGLTVQLGETNSGAPNLSKEPFLKKKTQRGWLAEVVVPRACFSPTYKPGSPGLEWRFRHSQTQLMSRFIPGPQFSALCFLQPRELLLTARKESFAVWDLLISLRKCRRQKQLSNGEDQASLSGWGRLLEYPRGRGGV